MEYLTYDETYWSCDIEADDLRNAAEIIWVVRVENVATGERLRFRKAAAFKEWLEESHRILIGHNFLHYDAPVLNRIWGTRITVRQIIDTFVLSQLYYPSLPGGHALEDWGVRLGDEKISFHDFSRYTEEMDRYCEQDVALTAQVYRALVDKMKKENFSEQGVELEHLAWNIIQNKQKENGFPFDQEKADLLYAELRTREEQLKDEIYRLWPPRLECVRTFARAFKADGTRTANYRRHLGQYPRLEDNPDGTYDAYDYVCFDLGSPQQRIQKLLDYGWTPVNFTKKGSPKIDEDEMLAFSETAGIPEVSALAKWCVVNARANMVRTWQNAVNPETGRIHGSLFLASTGRYRHSKPNTANIPGVRHDSDDAVLYGEPGTWAYECRSLWNSGGAGWRLVGIDGKGMQLRCLAHNIAATVGVEACREFIDDLLTGDPHRKNMARHGFPSKPAAKKAIYCVPLDTQCLTKQGWKTYDQLIEGELILTFNAEHNVKEWQPLKRVHYFDSAPVVEMGHSHGFRVRSTPDHRWFTQQRKSRLPFRQRPIGVHRTQELSTMQNIIVNAPLVDDTYDAEINWLQLPKYETDWVSVVLNMSQQERRSFLAGFCIADGHWHRNGHWQWTQLRGPLFEAALVASYLEHDGFITTSTRTLINGKELTTATLQLKPHVSTAFFEYKDLDEQPVWCPETDNQSWVMRQGDTITITGNTILMGGGDAKIAQDQVQFGWQPKKTLKNDVIDSIPGFRKLIDKLQKQLRQTGRIELCDGTRLIVPSDHMVVPYLLQGDESRLMKQAMIYVDEEVRRRKLTHEILKVGDIHDEWQTRVRDELCDDYVDFALSCFPRAGDRFGYLIQIEGDANVGDNWAQTH